MNTELREKAMKAVRRWMSLLMERFQVKSIWIVETALYDGSTAPISNHRTREGAHRALDKAWNEYFRPGNRTLIVSAGQLESIKNRFSTDPSAGRDWSAQGERDIFKAELDISDNDLRYALTLEGVGPRVRIEKVYP